MTVVRRVVFATTLPDFPAAWFLDRTALLSWYPDQPYEVAVRFDDQTRHATDWVIGWELLIAGLETPTGEGDVHIQPVGPMFGGERHQITLTTPDGAAVVHLRTASLRGFVQAVQAGWRPLEVDDAALAAWLEEAAP